MVRQQYQRSIDLDHCRNAKIEFLFYFSTGRGGGGGNFGRGGGYGNDFGGGRDGYFGGRGKFQHYCGRTK